MKKKVMRRIFFTILLIAGFSTVCWADEVVLSWDPNIEADLAGYNVYRAERVGNHSSAWKKVGSTAKDVAMFVDDVDGKNYAWQVTAYNTTEQESFVSNMVERYDRTPPMTVKG